MSKPLQFKKGDVLVFTTGAYSDFALSGFLVAIENLDLPELAKEFVGDRKMYEFDNDQFAGWLITKGKAMPCEHNVVHLGDYGEMDLS